MAVPGGYAEVPGAASREADMGVSSEGPGSLLIEPRLARVTTPPIFPP